MNRPARRRDLYAGLLIAMIGAGAILEGQSYGFGTLASIGSGFFPVMLGVGLVAMGALMAATGGRSAESAAAPPDWRGTVAIVAAVALFIALANTAGLAPATFACVFAGALGTRTTTWKEAAVLALGVTVFGIVLFSLGLRVQLPIIRGVLS